MPCRGVCSTAHCMLPNGQRWLNPAHLPGAPTRVSGGVMAFPRESGILLHPTSLPGPYGIGELGDAAFRFIEWMQHAGQRLWQVMPLGPTGYGDSPYASGSAFAGNPLLVSLSWLKGDDLLDDADLAALTALPTDHVDFGQVVMLKNQ